MNHHLHHHHHQGHRKSNPTLFLLHLAKKLMHRLPVIAAVIVFLILAAMPPLYFGGMFWWLPLAMLLAVLLLCTWMAGYAYNGSQWRFLYFSNARPVWHWSFLLLLLPILYGCVTLLELPGGVYQKAAPLVARIWSSVAADVPIKLSIYPGATAERIGFLALCLLLFIWIRTNCKNAVTMVLILSALVIGSLSNAIIAICQLVNGNLGQAVSGAFLNRNHFGFMMGLGICAAFALAGYLVPQKKKHLHQNILPGMPHHRRLSSIFFEDEDRSQSSRASTYLRLFLLSAIFIMYCTSLASLSRGAFLSGTASIIAMVLAQIIGLRHWNSKTTRNFYAIVIIVVGALVFSTPFLLDAISNRFNDVLFQDSISADTRMEAWRSTLQLIRACPWTGVGLGAYGDAIQRFAEPQMVDRFIAHAHNDWLEMIAECGIPLSCLLLAGIFTTLCIAAVRLYHQHDKRLKWVGTCAMIALVAGGFHELFDFNLQAYPVAIAFTVMAALLAVCGDKQEWMEAHVHTEENAVTKPASHAAEAETHAKTETGMSLASDAPESRQPVPTQSAPAPLGGGQHSAPMRKAQRAMRVRRALSYAMAFLALVVAIPRCIRYLRGEIAHTWLWSLTETGYQRRGKIGYSTLQKRQIAGRALAQMPCSAAVIARAADVYLKLGTQEYNFLESKANANADLGYALRLQRQALDLRPGSSDDWMIYSAMLLKQHQWKASQDLSWQDTKPNWLQSLDVMVACAPTMGNNLLYAARQYLNTALAIHPRTSGAKARENRALYLIRSVELYQQLLTAKPSCFKEVAPALLRINPSPAWIMQMFPSARNVENCPLLLKYLLESKLYEEAEALLNNLPPEFEQEADSVLLATLAGDRMMLARLNGKSEEIQQELRRQWLLQMREALTDQATKALPPPETLQRVPVSSITEKLEKLPMGYSPEAMQIVADYALTQGDAESAVMALLYDAYTLPLEPTAENLRRAIKTLDPMTITAPANVAKHLQFLKAALRIRLAWISRGSLSTQDVEKCMNVVRDMATQPKPSQDKVPGQKDHGAMIDNSLVEWHQRHLYSYYQGLACELINDKKQAIKCYQRVLDICPTHAPALLRLAELEPKLVAGEKEAKLVAIARQQAFAYFDISSALMQVTSSPEVLKRLHHDMNTEIWLEAMGETPYIAKYSAICLTATRATAVCELKPEDDNINMQIWPNGALLRLKGTFKMLPLTLMRSGRNWFDDHVELSLKVVNNSVAGVTPAPIVHAGKMDIQRTE